MNAAADPRVERALAALGRAALGEAYRPEISNWITGIVDALPAGDRASLAASARALESRAGALALTGRATPISERAASEVETVLKKWFRSRVPALRKLAAAATSLAAVANYSNPGPAWEEIGYPGPLRQRTTPARSLDPIRLDGDEAISCDVVVAGSGAGGSCAAAVLASAGLDVVVVEKGDHRTEENFSHIESEAVRDMYLYASALATNDLGVRIIAGSTLGGGTVVNFTTAFKTPDFVLREWAEVSGIDAFRSGEFESSLDEVALRLGVNSDSAAASRRDELLEEGLKKLGWHVDAMARAVRGCSQDETCGFCGFGCRLGAKQSALSTYLEDAADHGARIIIDADVREVRINDGRAVGLEAISKRHRLTISARAVIVAAGAIETPALLLRSGVGGNVGRHLHLHPGTAPVGIFDDDVRPWEGTLQARHSREFRDWDGGYGPIFETIPLHPGTAAAFFQWLSAADHLSRMKDLPRTSFCGVLMRDRSAGRVRLGREGSPRITYKLNRDDQRRTAEAVILAAKVLEASGAHTIISPHAFPVIYHPSIPGAHARWAEETRKLGYATGRVTYGSWHQMGSCRMGSDPTTSAIGSDNESHEVRNLFVTDSSAFPTSSGVNPMLSVYAIAHRAAKALAARLA